VDALILNGAREGEDPMAGVEDPLGAMLEQAGWKVSSMMLCRLEVAPCEGCFGCWAVSPGICTVDDAGREIARCVAQADLLTLLTPLTFGGYSSELKKAIDRLLPLVSPFMTRRGGRTRHRPRYRSYPKLLGLAVATRADEESRQVFQNLIERNARNFVSPAHAAEVLVSWATPAEVRAALERSLQTLEVAS